MSPVQRIDVDGVPVFTSPGPQRVTAALVFGVGIRDESYATLGVTHLIEHLVMGALPKSHLDCNAMVDVETTVFHATGRPAAVADFLAGVCAAVSDLPTDRMDLEVGVLQAENCAGSHPTAAALWAARFRLTGPGVAYAGGGTPEWLTEEAVRAHARRFFVRGNAALAWHGERREDLRLLLPEGFRPERSGYEVRPQSGPVWLQGPTGGVGLLLSATRPFPSELDVGVAVLQERMRDIARHERGLSYSTELQVVDVAADHSETALLVDAREGQNAAVAGVLWEQYLDLCRTGPSPAELAHAVAGFEAALDDEQEATAGALGRAAFCAVSGLPFRGPGDSLAAWREVTAEAAAAALRETLPGAVLMLPEGVEPGPLDGGIERRFLCNLVPALPGGTTFRPPLLARLLSRAARQKLLVVADDVLGHRDCDGDAHAIPWAEVEAAVPVVEGEGVFVVGRNLCGIEVHEDVYGRRAVEAVRERIPAHVWTTAPTTVEPAVRAAVPASP